jgi:hypothetical protein
MIKRWADHNKVIPGVEGLQSKGQWQRFKADFARQVDRVP